MKTFIDTNILLDVFGAREPFYENSSQIWGLAESGRVDGFVSAVSFTNIFYIVDRWGDAKSARKALVQLRDLFTPVACDALVVNQAIDSEIRDFEDAVQYFSALHADTECILTRNPDDFPRRPAIPVLTPDEFLTGFEA